MKIRSIGMSWFRGASQQTTLNTELMNVVIYGSNGSGKSSFSDAIEYIVAKGKIRHLMHEYSGSRQEKGVINTHAPMDTNATACVKFEGNCSVDVKITPDGTPIFSGNPEALVNTVQTWELERLILRQDEVAAFVEKTKGGKYSVLLPLLGLEHLEQAADNITKLRQSVVEEGDLYSKKANLAFLKQEAAKYFADLSEATATKALQNIAKDYIKGEIPAGIDPLTKKLSDAINSRIASLTPEITRHTLLLKVNEENLSEKLQKVAQAEEKILGRVNTLVDSQVEILQQASKYIDKLDIEKDEIECPACGRILRKDEFINHVRSELEVLKDLCADRDIAIEARRVLKSSIEKVLSLMGDNSITTWLGLPEHKELKEAVDELTQIREKDIQSPEVRAKLGKFIPVLAGRVEAAVAVIPPSNQKLINDGKIVEAATSIPSINRLENETVKINNIVQALDSSETQIRESIRSKTDSIIKSISSDIQYLWAKIHPNEPIQNVKLYIPEDEDKSIDIGLTFHGLEQPSPRLTLSEGHRNSLGLCIFLALARLQDSKQRPIFLDDIVSSLDRWHRGNITNLLLEEMTGRQVLLFTHDREWFQELRFLLPPTTWKFLTLKPWTSPSVGLQWSTSENTFDDARGLIAENCESAGNCVRQIMDSSLAIATEKLRIKMPYARGDRNDHRTCIEFLESVISEAQGRLRKEEAGSWKKCPEPIEDWRNAHNMIVSLANRASHTGSLVPTEVENLIQCCEIALNKFKCSECGAYIWFAEQTGREIMQCRCGKTQWKYG